MSSGVSDPSLTALGQSSVAGLFPYTMGVYMCGWGEGVPWPLMTGTVQ